MTISEHKYIKSLKWLIIHNIIKKLDYTIILFNIFTKQDCQITGCFYYFLRCRGDALHRPWELNTFLYYTVIEELMVMWLLVLTANTSSGPWTFLSSQDKKLKVYGGKHSWISLKSSFCPDKESITLHIKHTGSHDQSFPINTWD